MFVSKAGDDKSIPMATFAQISIVQTVLLKNKKRNNV
jgi:hypothetical protein